MNQVAAAQDRTSAEIEKAIADKAYPTFLGLVGLIVAVHPTFHFILGMIDASLPDSLALRASAAGLAVFFAIITLIFKQLRPYCTYMQIIMVVYLQFTVHRLVINADYHTYYMSASLIAVFCVPLAFFKVRDMGITLILSYIIFLADTYMHHKAGEKLLFYALFYYSAYFPSFVINAFRIKSLIKEISLSLELGSKNQELEKAYADLKYERSLSTYKAKMVSLGEMAGGIAHEINNPLTIISFKLAQMKKVMKKENYELPPKVSEIIEKIDTVVERMAKIISGLRAFARDGGADPYESCTVSKIIEDTMIIARGRFERGDVPLKMTPLEKQISIKCRPVQISQVLINILNNAYDAVDEQAEKYVELKVKEHDNYIVFEIIDNGPGIDPNTLDKISQPFFTTKPVGLGTGLGLSISKGIVEKHGGTIAVDPYGEFTRFYVFLPKDLEKEERLVIEESAVVL